MNPPAPGIWDADKYSTFSSERARPFHDLLAQVRLEAPRTVVDLGCGPGKPTRALAERWPGAQVVGVDSSPEMLEKARPLAIPGRLEFQQSGIAEWSCDRHVDLIVSNAALHWINDHEELIQRLTAMLCPGGVLAVQMPNRFDSPSQAAIEEAAGDPRWKPLLAGVGLHRGSVMPLSWYVSRLHELGFAVNAWETTYVHVLRGENPVMEWFKGTALRPLLAQLPANAVAEFEGEVGRRLQAAFPPSGDVTLFTMPRLFFVAERLPRR